MAWISTVVHACLLSCACIAGAVPAMGDRSANDAGHRDTIAGAISNFVHNARSLSASQPDISSACLRDLQLFKDALNLSRWTNNTTDRPFSFLMADSWGTRQSGYLEGDSVWEGSYRQCISARDDNLNTNISGKMCITEWSGKLDGIGTCIPSTCNETDVNRMLNSDLSWDSILPPDYKQHINSSSTFCVIPLGEKQITKDVSAMAAISVLGFFVLLSIIGTIYDLATMKRRRLGEELSSPMRHEYREYRIPRASLSGSGRGHGAYNQYENRAFDAGKSDLPPPSAIPQGFVTYPPPDYTERRPEYQYGHEWAGTGPGEPQGGYTAATNNNELWEPDTCGRICLAFSIRLNARHLLRFTSRTRTMRTLNGVRFLAFAWIVLGHTWSLGVSDTKAPTIANTLGLGKLGASHRATQFVIRNSSYSAESFFIMSALLVTISFMSKLKKYKPDCEMVGTYFFHRFWRLTPIYMLVLMAYGCLFNYIGAGPFYRGPDVITDSSNCKKHFWKHLIYLNNLIDINADTECMGWTWYLANEFQFYIISPVFLFALYYVPAFGIVLTVLAICGGLIANIYMEHQIKFAVNPPGVLSVDPYWDIYIKPWCRCTTYFMGMLLGYVLWRSKFKSKMNRGGVAVAWLLFLALSSTIMYAEWNWLCDGCSDWPLRAHVAFQALRRPFFGLVVCWVIYACITGYGGFINSILSWRGWLPLSRLTYAGYLFHPILIYYYYYQRPVQLYVYDIDMVLIYCGVLVLSLAAAFLLSLFLEVPLMVLEKVMFEKTPRNCPKDIIQENS